MSADRAEDTNEVRPGGEGRGATDDMTRRRPSGRLLVLALAAVTAALLVLGGGTSRSAFTGSIINNNNTTQEAFWSCRAADLYDKPSRLYSLADANGVRNLSSSGDGIDAEYVLSVLNLSPFRTDSQGCKRDPQGYLRASAGVVLLLAGAWVTSTSAAPLGASSVLSQEVWFKTSVKGGQLMGFGDSHYGLSSSSTLQVFLTSAGNIDFATGSGKAGQELLSPLNTYADNSWHQVVAVYDGGATNGKKLYVDGQLVATGSGTATDIGGAYWRLGYGKLSDRQNASASNNFEGGLQWAALYPTALTAAQVTAHYRAGVG